MDKDGTTILCMFRTYHPGYKAGGPIRSLVNLIQQLGDELNFRLLTADRDLGDTTAYPGIPVSSWVPTGKAQVMYLDAKSSTMSGLYRLLNNVQYDALYLNSFFDPTFTFKPLLLRRLGLIPQVPLIVAPRGQFSVGALSLKRWKKQAYLAVAKLLGLYRGAIWQATSVGEAADIRVVFGEAVTVCLAPDPPAAQPSTQEPSHRPPKASGTLKLVFLSRISPMKNLLRGVDLLASVRGNVEMDVYGPVEDKGYWSECQVAISRLPGNISVRYRGPVQHDRVDEVLGQYDLFFLPTLGENFGHVILEALSAGCPVLISDRTPWSGLQQLGIGWSLPLESPDGFRAALQECVDMDAQTHQALCTRAAAFGRRKKSDPAGVKQSRALFDLALGVKQTTAR